MLCVALRQERRQQSRVVEAGRVNMEQARSDTVVVCLLLQRQGSRPERDITRLGRLGVHDPHQALATPTTGLR